MYFILLQIKDRNISSYVFGVERKKLHKNCMLKLVGILILEPFVMEIIHLAFIICISVKDICKYLNQLKLGR